MARRASTQNDLSRAARGDDDEEVETGDYGSVAQQAGGKSPLRRRQTIQEGQLMFPSKNDRWTIDEDEASMDTVSMVVNLLADLSPAGVLPLANGMVYTGYIPSMVLLVVFAFAAAYMMYLVSRAMEITRQKSYTKMWIAVVGPKSAWIPPFVVFSVCFGCCLAYACMFGDLFAGCMPGFGVTWATRTRCLIILAVFPLLPLCFMKDLSMLAPTSFGALVAVVYTLIVMVIRYLDKSYAVSGQYYVEHEVETESHVAHFGLSSLSLVNALAVAFLCHYNGCKYYREYIGHTPGKFRNTVGFSFFVVSILFSISMLFGYLTFDKVSDAVILNNYSEDDVLVNVARLSMGAANVFSFPLMFSGLREQLIELMVFIAPSMGPTTEYVMFQNILSTVMLVLVIIVAILVTDASIVVGLVGSLCGSATIYVIPCIIFDRATLKGENLCSGTERITVRIIGFVGVFLMFAGAIVTLLPLE